MELIGQNYFSRSADVNALPSSQWLWEYLTFDRTLFSVEYPEQDQSCFWKLLRQFYEEDYSYQ